MEEENKQRLQRNLITLVQSTRDISRLLIHLVGSHVLTDADSQTIMSQSSDLVRCQEFYTCLMRKGGNAFQNLIEAFCLTGNEHLVEILFQDEPHSSESWDQSKTVQPEEMEICRIHRKRLRRHRRYLIENTTNIHHLTLIMEQRNVLQTADRQIIVGQPSDNMKFTEFYKTVMKSLRNGNASVYSALQIALSESGNDHISSFLASNDVSDTEDPVENTEIDPDQPSFIWFEVRDPVISFTGREKELIALHDALQKSHSTEFDTTKRLQATVLTQERGQLASLSGLGGVGKSEMARKYARDFHKFYDSNVIWIQADNHVTLLNSFTRLAHDVLGISGTGPDGKPKLLKSIIDSVYEYFSTKKSLFIFDNAEKYVGKNGLEEFLPLSTLAPNVHRPYILITSRNQSWAKGIHIMSLGTFSPEESLGFIKRSLQFSMSSSAIEEQEEKIIEMAEKLQHLPLALEQAVAFINTSNSKLQMVGSSYTVSKYLDTFENNTKDLLSYPYFLDTGDSYTSTVFTTWRITVEKIKEDETEGSLALKLLHLMAYCNPDQIPPQIFDRLIEQNPTDEGTLKLASGLYILRQYSMVNWDSGLFHVHRLVQHAVRLELKHSGQETDVLRVGLELFNGIITPSYGSPLKFKSRINEVKNQAEFLLGHAISFWEFAALENTRLVQEFKELPGGIVDQLSQQAKFHRAHAFAGKVVQQLESACEVGDESVVIFKAQAATVSARLGNFADAVDIMGVLTKQTESTEIPEENLQLDCQRRIITAKLYTAEGKHSEAIATLEHIHKDLSRRLGLTHKETLIAKYELGLATCLSHDFTGALNIFSQLMEESMNLNDTYELTEKICHGMGLALGHLGHLDQALEVYESMLHKQLQIHEDGNAQILPSILKTKTCIAEIFPKKMNYDAAIDLYKSIIDEMTISLFLPMDHPEVIRTRFQMANVLSESGKGVQVYNEVLEDQSRVLSPSHPSILQSKMRVVSDLIGQSKYDEALPVALEVYKVNLEERGAHHQDTADVQSNLSVLYELKGDYEKALEYSERATSTVLTNHAPSTRGVQIQIQMGIVLMKLEQYREAKRVLKEAHKTQVRLRSGVDDSRECLEIQSKIAFITFKEKKNSTAIQTMEGVIERMKLKLGPEHPNTVIAGLELNEMRRQWGNSFQRFTHGMPEAKYMFKNLFKRKNKDDSD